MVKLIMSTPMADKIIGFFEGYKDHKISCKFIGKKGIKSYFECETEMSPEEAANYCKSLFKKSPGGAALYFSIQPDGFFG